MRFIYFGLTLTLLAISASAKDKKSAAPQSSTSILVNGQPVRGKVLEVDGKHYIAVEDLAQSLQGTISYSPGQIALTLPQPPPERSQPAVAQAPAPAAQPPVPQPSVMASQPPVPQPPTATAPPGVQPVPAMSAKSDETGSVKGTLTYFFSVHVGNKPDTGSKLWLLKGHVEIPADQTFVGTSTAIGTSANPEQYNAIKYAVADENGNFELPDIPPGEYTLVMQSAHTKGTLKEKRDIFGKASRSNLRDSSGRIETLDIVVKSGKMVDASKDFGPNLE